jgi:hypothetical protein
MHAVLCCSVLLILTGLGAAARWKDSISSRLGSLFAARGADLAAWVYGTPATSAAGGGEQQGQGQQKRKRGLLGPESEEDEDEEELFRPKGSRGQVRDPKVTLNDEDIECVVCDDKCD